MAGPQEALLVAELEAVQVVGLLGPSLQAREAQAHVDTGVQLLRGEPVHPGQEALAQPLHQRAVHLGYLLGKRRGQVRVQGEERKNGRLQGKRGHSGGARQVTWTQELSEFALEFNLSFL